MKSSTTVINETTTLMTLSDTEVEEALCRALGMDGAKVEFNISSSTLMGATVILKEKQEVF